MTEPHEENDKDYATASARTLGRMWGEMFNGMLEQGMTREEALDVISGYATQMAANPPTLPDTDDTAS